MKRPPRVGTEVRFVPNPASLRLYSDPPAINEEGVVTRIALPGGKGHYLRGPGGGLLYVDWDEKGPMGVSLFDVVTTGSGIAILSRDQVTALQKYMRVVGRTWKRELTEDWASAHSRHVDSDTYHHLHVLRNTLGGRWLMKFKPPW